jgi:PAS domain S-box-containing protein
MPSSAPIESRPNVAARASVRGVIVPFLVALSLMLLVALVSFEVLATLRAYVEGEGLYSKGQKDAVYYLTRYLDTHDDADFQRYAAAITKPLGDRAARLALLAPRPDMAAAREGFLAGGNHPDDVPRLIWFFRLFRWTAPFHHALDVWTSADGYTERIVAIAGRAHQNIEAASGQPALDRSRIDLAALNLVSAPLEDDFSATLGAVARRATTWLSVLVLVLGATIGAIALGASRARLRERQAYDAELRDREARFRSLFASSIDAIVIARPDGTIEDANAAACELFGQRREALCASTTRDLVDGAADLPSIDGITRGEQARGELTFRRGSETFHGEASVSRFHDRHGEIHYSATIRDLTPRRRLEHEQRVLAEQLQHARQMEAIGQLAGGIAHDFNNILAAIVGYSGLLERELPRESKAHAWASRISSSGLRGKELVQQILAFARKGGVEKSANDLVALVHDACELLSASLPSSTEFVVSLPAEPIVVHANPAQLSQVVVNLCVNARDALQERPGRIAIELRELPPGDPERVGFAATSSGDGHVVFGELDERRRYARIAVSDSGAGMDTETLQSIFTPFFTTKRRGKGTGLGLAVVHGIVSGSGGACAVESAPGRGTTFRIYLPVVERATLAEDVRHGDEDADGKERVLVVDDEPFVAEVLQEGLARLGYSVTVATDPVTALEWVEQSPERFDVVVTDQLMPKLTGLDLLARLRRLGFTIPVIICSGFSNRATDGEVTAAGAAAFLHKPASPIEVGRSIRRAMAGAASDPGAAGG